MTQDLAASQARLRHLTRLLFDRAPALLPQARGIATQRPFLSNLGLHLPEAGRAIRGEPAARWYDAATLHASAHLRHPARWPRGKLVPVQMALVGVLEDARVERLAIAELPGLRGLWLPYHRVEAAHGDSFVVLMLRLARCLLDPQHPDPHPWVMKGRALFEPMFAAQAGPAVLRDIASRLGHDIGQMRLPFNSRDYVVEPAYRDDNGHLWEEDEDHPVAAQPKFSADEAPTPPKPPDQPVPAEARVPEDDTPPPGRWQYPEWDRLVNGYRPAWCTVLEERPRPDDPRALEAALLRHARLQRQLERAWHVGRQSRPVRLRAQAHGPELDLDAAVGAAIDRRSHRSTGDKVHQRLAWQSQALSVLVLLDASTSTGDALPGRHATLLDLAREAALLTATALTRNEDRCAVHAFASNGRHEVRYQVAIDFGEPLDAAAIGRLAGVHSRLSTRVGAALRHATSLLAAETRRRRLLLFVTDGAPHDIDIHDARYLTEDARRAVQEAARRGVDVFCISLDPGADGYLRAIFGAGRYRVLDRVESLAEVLPATVRRLAR